MSNYEPTLTDQLPPLDYGQQSVLEYIKAHPGLTNEDICNARDGGNVYARYGIANAVEFLVWKGFCNRDARTGAVTAREIAK